MMKRISLRTIFSILMILILLLNFSALALAQETARIYLQQVEDNGNTLTVEVMVDKVASLYGVQFNVIFDPAVFSVQDADAERAGIQIEPGALLPTGSGQSFVVANKVEEANGTVTFAMTLLNPTPAVSGGGSLGRITFNKLQNTPTMLDLASVKLVSDQLQTIPSETAGLSIGQEQAAASGPAETPPAAGGSDFPWWIIAVVIMFLGVVVLAGLIVIGSKSRSVAPAKTQQPARPQPTRPSGSRPSAFKQQPGAPADLAQKPQQPRLP
ncbi:MAG: hypothetical protein JXM69_04720 [Anaerolineae bacterium]|nr:hypothetical protein [Anaerolineae bacterium]